MGFDVSFNHIGLDPSGLEGALAEVVAVGVQIMEPLIDQVREEPHQNMKRFIYPSPDGITVDWALTPPRPHSISPTLEHRFKSWPKPPWLHFFWASTGPAEQAWGGPDRYVYFKEVHWKPRYAPRRALYEPVLPKAKALLEPLLRSMVGDALVSIEIQY